MIVVAVPTLALVAIPAFAATPRGANVTSVPIPPGNPPGTDATIVLPTPPDGADECCVNITVAVVNVFVLTLKFLIETIPTGPPVSKS